MASRGPLFSAARRCLSTATPLPQLVKPPVMVFGTEGRYAMALYSAATKQKALDVVEKDLKTFQEQLQKDPRLREFLADPTIKRSLKSDGLSGACDRLKLSPLSKNLFMAMAEHNRFREVNSIVNAFGTIMSAHRGEVICEVTTAKPIDAAMQKEVESAIAGFLKSGEKSFIKYKVNSDIIGGMIVSIGDKYVDMSMASKLKKYEDIIKSAA